MNAMNARGSVGLTMMAFAIVAAVVLLYDKVRHHWPSIRAAIAEARKSPPALKATTYEEAKAGAPIPILIPANDPLVTSRATGGSANPLPLSHMPIRSLKADAKRAAHEYAERRAGRALSWKAARKLMGQWERLEREAVNS